MNYRHELVQDGSRQGMCIEKGVDLVETKDVLCNTGRRSSSLQPAVR